MNLEQQFLSNVELALYISKADQTVKNDILQKYDIIAGVKIGESTSDIIVANKNNLSVLMNRTAFITLISSSPVAIIENFKNLDSMIKVLVSKEDGKRGTKVYNKLYSELSQLVANEGAVCMEDISADDISKALDTFGIAEVSEDEIADIELELNEGDLSIHEEIPDDIFDGEDEPEELVDIEDGVDAKENDEVAKTDKYIEAFKAIYEGADEDSTTPLKTAIDGIMKSLDDLYMSCFSGITTPDGILTNRGLLSFIKSTGTMNYKFVYNKTDISKEEEQDVTSPKYIAYSQQKSKYGQYYKAVMYAIGVVAGGAGSISPNMESADIQMCINEAVERAEQVFGKAVDGRKSVIPKLADAQSSIQYYPRLHTEFMTGNFHVSEEMEKWAKEAKIHRNAFKVTNFDDLMQWARKRVSDCLTEALIDAGLKIEDAGSNDAAVTSICQLMSKNIKNIMVITNMKKGYFTLKICTAEPLDANRLSKCIIEYFNYGSAGSKAAEIVVKNTGSDSGVIEYDVVLNRVEYDKPAAMSADVIDDIVETGNIPSWSNVIFGERSNGGTLTYNLKKDVQEKASLSIYGKSGSGKGIMTSALLSAAVAEGCEIFYFDGKPDNGAALGKVAWDNGVDAAIFNGKFPGSDNFCGMLEDFSHGIRDNQKAMFKDLVDRIPQLDDIESWPFKTKDEANRTKLVQVSYALQGFQFVYDTILERSNHKRLEYNPDGSVRWAVFVIDEIEVAAQFEQSIRNLMTQYMENAGEREVYKDEVRETPKGNIKTQKKDGKIKDYKNWDKDTGYLFCKKWLDWADSRCNDWGSIISINLRTSNSTLITLFQSNAWLNQSGNISTGKTKLGKMMLALAGSTLKIVGLNALQAANKWGDKESREYSWSGELDKKKWVIAKNAGGLSEESIVFKPFQIYTSDLGAKTVVPFDDYGAGAPLCYKNKEEKAMKSQNGLKKPVGLQSYLIYMFNGLQDEINKQIQDGKRLPGTETPQGVLSTSLTYFDKVIKESGLNPNGIMDYMYNIPAISNFDGTLSPNERAALAFQEANSSNNIDADEDNLNAMNAGVVKSEGEESIDFGNTGSFEKAQMLEQLVKGLRFTTTQSLIKANMPNELLTKYIERFCTRFAEKNTFDYSNRNIEKGKGGNNGLRIASIMLGTMHYASKRGVYNLNNLVTIYKNNVNSNTNVSNSLLGLGMLNALDTQQLAYDDMPSRDMMREWLSGSVVQPSQPAPAPSPQAFQNAQAPQPVDTSGFNTDAEINIKDGEEFDPDNSVEIDFSKDGMFDENDFNNGSTKFDPMLNIPDEDPPISRSAFSSSDGKINFSPRANQNVLGIPNDSFVEAYVPKYSTAERFKKSLFEHKNGVSYEFKKRWEYILKSASLMFPSRSMVVRFTVAANQVTVNGKIVGTNGIIGDDNYGIELADIIRIRDTFKKFPMINQLVLDNEAAKQLIVEYGSKASSIWNLFRENRALKTLSIIPDNSGTPVNFNRNNFEHTTNELERILGLEVERIQQEKVATRMNPRLQDKPVGYKLKAVSDKSFKLSEMSPEVKKFASGGLKVGALIAVGAVVGWPLMLVSLLGYNQLKNKSTTPSVGNSKQTYKRNYKKS